MDLKGKVIVITGGTGGLGKPVAREFLDSGAKVITTYIDDSEFDELRSAFTANGENLTGFRVNLLSGKEVEEFSNNVAEKFSKVDILVNLAGGFFGGVKVSEMEEEDWDKMIDMNLKTAFLSCKNFLPFMLEQNQGKIINMGSRPGLQGAASLSAYSASKAAVINLTQTIAEEVKDHNININVILPSVIDTPANREAMPDADFDSWVKPESIAKVIMFLSGEESADISGAYIPVYGNS